MQIKEWLLSDENVNAAIGNLARLAREEQDAAAVYRALAASPLVGKVASRALLPALCDMFPEWRVSFYIDESRARARYLMISRNSSAGRYESHYIQLATLDEKRIDADKLKAYAQECEQSARDYLERAANIPGKVLQLRAILPYLQELESAAQDVEIYYRR